MNPTGGITVTRSANSAERGPGDSRGVRHRTGRSLGHPQRWTRRPQIQARPFRRLRQRMGVKSLKPNCVRIFRWCTNAWRAAVLLISRRWRMVLSQLVPAAEHHPGAPRTSVPQRGLPWHTSLRHLTTLLSGGCFRSAS